MTANEGNLAGRAGKVLDSPRVLDDRRRLRRATAKRRRTPRPGRRTTAAGGARTTRPPRRQSCRPSPTHRRPTSHQARRQADRTPSRPRRPPAARRSTRSIAISGETVMPADLRPGDGHRRRRQGARHPRRVDDAERRRHPVDRSRSRSGIKFHDGTALDGAALKAYIEAGRCSPLVATAFGEFGGCPSTFDPAKPEDPKTNRKPVSTIYKAITVDPADPMKVTIDLLAPYAILDYSAAGWWLMAARRASTTRSTRRRTRSAPARSSSRSGSSTTT